MRKTITLCDLCGQDIDPHVHYIVITHMPYPLAKQDIHLHVECMVRWANENYPEWSSPIRGRAKRIVEQDRELLVRFAEDE